MTSIRLIMVFAMALIGGCGDDRRTEPAPKLPVESLPGVYSGVFPCAECPGIPTTLWLRGDGRFFIRQAYPAVDGRDAVTAFNLGRWQRQGEANELVLRGAGPTRTFVRSGPDALRMRTDSELEHRLDRDPAVPEFLDTIRLTGAIRVSGSGVEFTECLAGFVVPVARGGDYSRLLHQYRSAGSRSGPTYVELDGRFAWSADGAPRSMTVERFITVKDDGAC